MKIKTSELTGAALDWAVAKCEGALHPLGNVMIYEPDGVLLLAVGGDMFYDDTRVHYNPSGDWSQGGPIIEREGIAVMRIEDRQAHQQWAAGEHDSEYADRFWEVVCGPTPLIAAMRCYVASKLGDEVAVPDELV